MVLDPFSALGLASNVVQFVDFGTKLFTGAAELYHSVDGTLAVNAQLELITKDLSTMSAELGTANFYGTQPVSAELKNLMELALSCKQVADEVLVVLTKLKVPNGRSKWKSIRQALAGAWKEKEIRAYMEKLDRFRSQMTAHLIAILSNKQSSVLEALNDLSELHQRLEVMSVNEPLKLKTDILAAIREISSENAKQEDLLDLKEKLSACENESNKLYIGLRVLEKLHFPMIRSRYTNIAVAHSSTYEWIFQRTATEKSLRPHFVDWLESGNGIYWINGKAGSGKSTLMKFITGNDRTIGSLQIWAGHRTLVTGSYFLWHSGTEMQKSLEGLLRSLLYSILQQCPTMMSALPVLGLHTDQVSLDTQSWSLQELLTTFSQLKTDQASVRFCFFIDGLDEYGGFHADVIDIIMSLISSPNIKVCLSSRPWNIFEDAFGGEAYPSLRLQDLTRGDIRTFVMDKLEGDRRFAELKLTDGRYENLVSEIVEKAQGVFLWVSLVVRSLLRGLTNADTISDLQRRLALLPTDLEKYFRFMLDSTEKVYHGQAARMFQICLASRQPVSLITLSFYDEQDPEYGMEPNAKRWRKSDLDELHQLTRKRVNARCVDLVEVTFEEKCLEVSPFKVEFIHRTVRDFLETKAIQNVFAGRQGKGFDADNYLCQAYLTQMKHMPPAMDQLTTNFLFHAYRLERRLERSQNSLLDEFLRINVLENSSHFELRMPKAIEFKVNTDSRDYQLAWLLARCVRQGLVFYVRSQLEASDRRFGPAYINWLLKLALTSSPGTLTAYETDLQKLRSLEIKPEFLRFLMSRGADPNYSLEGRSIWDYFLRAMGSSLRTDTRELAQYLEVLLSKGTNSDTNDMVRNAIGFCPKKDRSQLYALCSDTVSSSASRDLADLSRDEPSVTEVGKSILQLSSTQSMDKSSITRNKKAVSQILAQLYRLMKIWLRPGPRMGHVRITWTCGCGEEMYTDVKEQSPGSAQSLQARLRSSAAEARMHRSEELPQEASFRRPGIDTMTVAGSPSDRTATNNNNDQDLNRTTSSFASSKYRNDQWNAYNSSMYAPGSQGIQDTAGSTQDSSATLSSAGVCKLLLCINQNFLPSWQPTCLEQVDLSGVTNDQHFFERVCAFYRQSRKSSRWRLGNTKIPHFSLLSWWPQDWSLFVPYAALYVKFDLVPSRPDASQGPIGPNFCPRVLCWNVLPPKKENVQGNYKHHPCPNDGRELVSNQFIHTMLRPGEPHTSSFWLHEAPKKIKEALPQQYGTTGWGILIVEGPNWTAFVVLSSATISLITLIAIIYSAMKGDSHGFGVGSYLVGALGVELAVLIMIANMSFSPSKMAGTGK